uniref:Major facilitator superfamily (MFS) profile domain-containing protein n=1 Tax=Setaria digitata TaxID=48799 RepID=A0A915PLG3_9BILA
MGLPPYLLSLSLAACFNGNFQQAYLLSILNQPYLEIHQFINESTIARSGKPIDPLALNILWSLVNVMNPVSGIVGQMIAYLICDRIGRRWTAITSCLIAIPALLLSMFTRQCFPYYEALVVGRFLWGTANGIAIVVQTVWIVESASAMQRGFVNSWQEVIATIGNLLTQLIGVPFSTAELWPFMFAIPLAVTVISLVVFILMYESPQYALMFSHDRQEAALAIRAYHGLKNDLEINEQIKKYEEDGQRTEEAKKEQENTKEPNGFEIMFMPWKANDPLSTVIRFGAWVGIMVKIAYVFTGARVIRSFNTFIYHNLGKWPKRHSQWGSLANTIIRLPLSVIPIFIIERAGRRPLIIISQFVSLLSLSMTMLSILIGEAAKLGTLISVSLVLFATSLGIGSVSRFYSAELVPKSMILRTVTVLSLIESFIKIILDFGFYPLATITGGYSFLIFILPSVLFLILMIFYCPETKKQTVNEILNEMAWKLNINIQFKV